MLLKIYENNPSPREVARVVKCLQDGGVVIYPTDGVYAFGCSMQSSKAVARLKQICGKSDDRLTVVCSSLSQISELARVDNPQFKVLKRNLPGPFTFILEASSRVPDKILGKRKTIGVRMPDNSIAQALLAALECPMVSASVKDDDEVVEYTTDPELIEERYDGVVDMVVDGGYGSLTPTTLVDLTDDEPEVLREGGGELIW
ncbi:MAG: threonylcarbamoyl-AMP synthase [Tidjanibacter sp.]|nr:threonylcarbamoyl-AMP synthase [Tidjanibacter sp.]